MKKNLSVCNLREGKKGVKAEPSPAEKERDGRGEGRREKGEESEGGAFTCGEGGGREGEGRRE